jgi:hypothetical protein
MSHAAADDPILAATTVSAFLEAVERKYHLGLAVDEIAAVLRPVWGESASVGLVPSPEIAEKTLGWPAPAKSSTPAHPSPEPSDTVLYCAQLPPGRIGRGLGGLLWITVLRSEDAPVPRAAQDPKHSPVEE